MTVFRSVHRIVLGTALVMVVAGGCGSASVQSDPSGASSTGSTPTTASAPPLAQVGETLTNRGVQLTVKAVRSAETIEMNQSGFRPGSGYEKYTEVQPDPGGKFVIVETHVVNKGRRSMDLTCSLPITTAVADIEDRMFDPIQDLYQLRGNPECNKLLQPGFESDMTYVFMVPATATVVRFGFYDSTDFDGNVEWSRFAISA